MTIEEAKNAYPLFAGFGFRPGQREAIEYCRQSTKPVTVLRAPVGSGKTMVGMVLGQMYDKYAYLCSSKQLQDQIQRDHGRGVDLLMGRSNYQCNAMPTLSAAQCISSNADPCDCLSKCNYKRTKERVAQSRRQILNYNYMLSEFNYVGQISQGEPHPIMIADEADVLGDLLTGFISLSISKRNMLYWGLEAPPRKGFSETSMSVWFRWADDCHKALSEKLAAMDKALEMMGDAQPYERLEVQGQKQRIESSIRSFELFIMHADKSWIADESESGYQFRPLWLSQELAQQYYWRHASKHVLMSGTWPPLEVLAKALGLPRGDIDMIEVASCFPAENRPVHICNIASMSHNNQAASMPIMLDAIKRIMAKHHNQKGIIHTSNYSIANAIMALGDPRLVSHAAADRAAVVSAFKASSESLVFVSPSSTRGLDLPDDDCRFNILAKAPYQSLADKLVSNRLYTKPLGQLWYSSLCAQEIEQAFGRGVRHETDWCENYSLDMDANKLICSRPELFSDHFRKSLVIHRA